MAKEETTTTAFAAAAVPVSISTDRHNNMTTIRTKDGSSDSKKGGLAFRMMDMPEASKAMQGGIDPTLLNKLHVAADNIKGKVRQLGEEMDQLYMRPLVTNTYKCIVHTYDRAGTTWSKEELDDRLSQCRQRYKRARQIQTKEMKQLQKLFQKAQQDCHVQIQQKVQLLSSANNTTPNNFATSYNDANLRPSQQQDAKNSATPPQQEQVHLDVEELSDMNDLFANCLLQASNDHMKLLNTTGGRMKELMKQELQL